MRGRQTPPLYKIVMSNKDKYRLLCNTEKNIPIFSHDWWLDTVCGEKKWDVLLIEQKGRIQATLPLYVPHSDIVSMPSYTQTMGPWFAASSSDTKYTTELGRRQELCKQFTEELNSIRTSCKISIMTLRIGFRFIGRDITKRTLYLFIKKYPGSSSGMGEYEPQYPAKYCESAE